MGLIVLIGDVEIILSKSKYHELSIILFGQQKDNVVIENLKP